MLFKDFKAVDEVDTKILELHQQLKDLYDVRHHYTQYESKHLTSQTIGTSTDIQYWATQQYESQKDSWSHLGVALPRYAVFQNRLMKAHREMRALSTIDPRFRDNLEVLIVPPINKFNVALYSAIWTEKYGQDYDHYFDNNLPAIHRTNRWRVLIVYSGQEPLKLGSAISILKNNKHMFGSYDMSALGIIEFAAFTLLRKSSPLNYVWELLLRDYDAEEYPDVVSAAFINGSYRYEVDDPNGLFESEFFRPAVEIT